MIMEKTHRRFFLMLGVCVSVMVLVPSISSCASTKPLRRMELIPAIWEPQNIKYRSFYGWEESAGSWKLERISGAGDETVAVHVFRSFSEKVEKGTVFIHHGYLEHTALRVPIILRLVKMGWTVVGVDLPGHGLSTGVRANIDTFNDYAQAFESAMNFHVWPQPWRVIAHSTGGATTLLSMQRTGRKFDFVVLEAPLVRTFLWTPSIWLKNLLGEAISTVPRRDGGIAPDQAFFSLLKRDPLYISEVPVDWINAVEKYYQSTLSWSPMPGRVLILQGTKDTVVDTDYNIPFLRGILPDAEIVQIEGGQHHLLMDEGPAGEEARKALFSRW